MKPLSEGLPTIIRQRTVATAIENARLTRDYPGCLEKVEEARRQVRFAMYDCALGHLTLEERDEILAVLKPCCPEIFVSEHDVSQQPLPPLAGLEDPPS